MSVRYRHLSPCVDFRYGFNRGKLVLSVRRFTSDGKSETADGVFLCDRADWILDMPAAAEHLGKVLRKALDASRQLGKRMPQLAEPFEAVFGVSKNQIDEFHPGAVWTNRDDTTPYALGATRSHKVDLERVEVPKAATDEELGSALLALLDDISRLCRER